jgi:hypothetical protein
MKRIIPIATLLLLALLLVPWYAQQPNEVAVMNAPDAYAAKGSPRERIPVFDFWDSVPIHGHSAAALYYRVEDGKRLIVETISAKVELPQDQEVVEVSFNLYGVGPVEDSTFFIPMVKQGTSESDGLTRWVGCQQVRICALPGTTILGACKRNVSDENGAKFYIGFSGYLLSEGSHSLAP